MELLHTIYLIAITAEAMSGAIMGMRRGMDLFGICLLGTVTALGGGTARDVLLGHYPVGWIAHPEYLTFTIGAAIVTGFIARYLHHLRMVFLLVDGLGLVAFTVIGCDVAMGMGAHPSIVVLAGVITGIFGGLMRDVLCNQVPMVLQRELYATVALFTGVFYVGMLWLEINTTLATLAALGSGFLFRVLAMTFHWKLPDFNGKEIRGLD
ncbi:trimeric intracellular cation channel family protein [Stutzerimonas kunmingensis]|uniref:trimeric intracellular cation channel family protein n=1 Tax=Stutzerimonas kunmingensis TaxID=1211807 RepID=UPI001F41213C|nr:trimeric intracellular cation channel family protein [Stutzerimonas kunmingensis]UIP34611.1 trimeric intracellular cation channel family protein [Stutzerimonas kunmingensis]